MTTSVLSQSNFETIKHLQKDYVNSLSVSDIKDTPTLQDYIRERLALKCSQAVLQL